MAAGKLALRATDGTVAEIRYAGGGNVIADVADVLLASKVQTANITVRVPEDFATVNLALVHLTKTYTPTHGFTAEVSLANGYVISEQILVDGQDLSWIKLTSRSTNGKHLVDRNALTVNFGAGYGLATYPVFGAKNGASSPVLTFVLDGQVALGSATANDGKMGIVALGAKVSCSGTAGAIQMSGVACHARAGGTISAHIMTNSSDSGVACFAQSGGTISTDTMTNSSNASHACYAVSGTISANTMTNSSNNSNACHAASGTISANTMTNSSDSGYGCFATRGGTILANNMTNSSDSNAACFAQSGTISVDTMTNSSNASFACYAARGGTISANIMTNSSDSSAACFALSGGTISANNMTLFNAAGSTQVLAYVAGGGSINSYLGTWTDNGTGGKANQAAVTVTTNGYINRIG